MGEIIQQGRAAQTRTFQLAPEVPIPVGMAFEEYYMQNIYPITSQYAYSATASPAPLEDGGPLFDALGELHRAYILDVEEWDTALLDKISAILESGRSKWEPANRPIVKPLRLELRTLLDCYESDATTPELNLTARIHTLLGGTQ